MVFKIPKFSISTIFILFPILYFNSCTFEFIKPFSFVLPVVGVCILAWLVFLAKERADINVRNLLPMMVYAFIMCVLLMLGAQSRVSILPTDLRNTLYLLLFMCVFAIYSDERYQNDRSFIVFVWIVDTVISCGYSIYRLIKEPNLSRLLSTGSYHGTNEAISARGIVSFGVIYGLVLIVLVLFFLAVQNKKGRLLNIFLFLLFITLLFFAQFLIAIFLVGAGLIWIIFINNPKNNKNKLLRIICFIIIGIICVFSLPFLFEVLVDSNIFRYEINARLQELLMFFKGENLGDTDLLARFSQYSMSLTAFTSSYGLGKIAIDSVEVGSHSQWLDGLGNYGLLFFLYIFAMFMFCGFVIERLPNKKSKQLYRMLFVIYIMMSLTNTSTWAPITLSLCVIVPFLCLDKVTE